MLRITKTESGMVKGFPGTDARITVFKGIPYADDPSGENRWRAPQKAKSWEGIRECYAFGPITMQAIPGADPNAFYSKEWNVDPEIPMAEDGSQRSFPSRSTPFCFSLSTKAWAVTIVLTPATLQQ